MAQTQMERLRAEALEKLEDFKKTYDELTKVTSPKHWRLTGHHFCHIREMEVDIKERFTEISPEEFERAHMLGLLN
jgi:DNA-binding ferritin-like protein